MTRQQRLNKLVAEYWEWGLKTPDLTPGKWRESSETIRMIFQSVERELAEFVAKNVDRISIKSNKK